MPHCEAAGVHKAPKGKDAVGSNRASDFYYFCKEHILEYNKSWDFFSGMSMDEIEAFRTDAITGHRPTWALEQRVGNRNRFTQADLEEALRRFEGFSAPPPPPPTRPITTAHMEALAVLDLLADATPTEVRSRYKILVKQLHPDVNKSRGAEERFKRVTEAYRILKDYPA